MNVYVLADAFGSYGFPEDEISDLQKSGVHFRFFSPLFSSESFYFGRRLHHKIAVADKKAALVGGINIADKYRGIEVSSPAWLDYAVYIKGDACTYLHALCEQIFQRQKFSGLQKFQQQIPAQVNHRGKLIRFRRNDWMKGKNEIRRSYVNAILTAEKSVTIVASYFLPGLRMRKLLAGAAARGIEVKLILAGKSDIASERLAESYLYNFYLRNNIQLYEWNNSVMHGKAMLVDDRWATIGSYNLNYLSHYISIELNVDVIDTAFAKALGEHLAEIIRTKCVWVVKEKLQKNYSWLHQLRMWIAYTFYNLVKALVMIGKKQERASEL